MNPNFNPQHSRVVVLGNGPSLRGFDLHALTDVDAIGMNAAYRFWERVGWYPTHYVCLDDQLIETHADAIHELIISGKVRTAFLISRILDFHPDLADRDNVVFLESFNRTRQARVAGRGVPLIDSVPFRESDPSKVTTGAYAIRYAAHLGYRDVAVLGVDLRYVEILPEARRADGIKLVMASTPQRNPNYFFDDYQRAGDKFNVPNPNSHERNLHVAAFEVLAHDTVHFAWTTRVWNGNRRSVLFDKAIFPHVDIQRFVRGRSLGAVVIPTTAREESRLLANLSAWDHPRLAPSVGAVEPGARPDLVIAFSGAEDAVLRQRLVDAFDKTRHVQRAFARLDVRFIGLSRSLDYYERDYTRKVSGRGYKSGPNEQFFELMGQLAGRADFIFYMESDCVPLRQGWLDKVRELAEGDAESWVIGSVYRGVEAFDDRFFLHLNGNALYRVGDPEFIDFVQRYWRPALYDLLETTDKRMAYDCLLSQHFTAARPSERNAAWQVFQAVAHRLRATGVIQNISGAGDRQLDVSQVLRRLLTECSETWLVHGASFADYLHRHLSSPASPTAPFAWSDVIGEAANETQRTAWEQAVDAALPRLLIIDPTVTGSRSATGQIKELFVKGWPRDRLLQIHDTPQGPALKRFTAGDEEPPPRDLAALVQACVDFDPEAIYLRPVDSQPLFDVLAALQRVRPRPLVVHMMDDWPERARVERPTAYPALDASLRAAISSAQGWLAIGQAMASAYRVRYRAAFVPLANGVDVAAVASSDHAARPPASREHPFVLRYLGGLARDMTFESVVEVARAVAALSKTVPVRMEVYTMPWYRADAERELSRLQAVTVLDLVEEERYAALLAESDALLIAYNFDEATRRYAGLSLANKLPECLASGAPLLAYGPRTIATIDLIEQAGCACVVTQHDDAALGAAIRSLVESPQRCRELGEAGRRYAADHLSEDRAVEGFRSTIRRAMLRFDREAVAADAPPAPSAVPTGAGPVDEAGSFSEANRLLREGHYARALAIYRHLHQRRPLSVYAQNAELAETLLAANNP